MEKQQLPVWHDINGENISCHEKLKVMEENISELKQVAKDAFEDGILMGIDHKQLYEYFIDLMKQLNSPFKDKNV